MRVDTTERKGDDEPGAATPDLGAPGRVLLVVAVAAVVATLAGGLQVLAPAATLESRWAVGALRALGLATAAAGAFVLLRRREVLLGEARDEVDPAVGALRTAAVLMVLVTAVAMLNPPPRADRDPRAGLFPSGIGGPPGMGRGTVPLGRPPAGGPSDPLITGSRLDRDAQRLDDELVAEVGFGGLARRIMRGLPAFLIVAVVVGYFVLKRMKTRNAAEPLTLHTLEPVAAAAGFEASIEALLDDRGAPREQIAAAYHRLLVALAAAGAGKHPQEAPYEHLDRALAPLGVSPGPLRRLAELYVVSEFSRRPVTEGHKREAGDALTGSLASLRAAHALPAPADERTEAPASDRSPSL